MSAHWRARGARVTRFVGRLRRLPWRGALLALMVLIIALAARNAATPGGESTALHEAALAGDSQSIDQLLAEGEPVDAADLTGQTPLMLAATRGNVGAVRALLDRGADVNAADLSRETPLHMAAIFGNAQVVAELLARGAAVDRRDSCGRTPFQLAAGAGRKDIAKLLIDHAADLKTAPR